MGGKMKPKVCPYCKKKIYAFYEKHVLLCKFKEE